MASYLKEIDPYDHIVTTSVSHREIEGLYALEELDLNQMHIYKRTKQIPEGIMQYTEMYNKPFSWGEFGYEWDWNKDFSKIAEEFDHDFKIGLWYGLFHPTPVLPMSWWWEFFDERGMTGYFNSVSEINGLMLSAGKGSFEQLETSAGTVESYGVKCGERLYVYVLNDSGSSENLIVRVSANLDNQSRLSVKAFNPETRSYHELKETFIENGSLTISGIELNNLQDVVLILSE